MGHGDWRDLGDRSEKNISRIAFLDMKETQQEKDDPTRTSIKTLKRGEEISDEYWGSGGRNLSGTFRELDAQDKMSVAVCNMLGTVRGNLS